MDLNDTNAVMHHEPDDTEDSIFCRGMNFIRALPDVRSYGRKTDHSKKDLKAAVEVLQSYLDSAKTSTPPSKKLLHMAAKSLMQEGAVLSKKWDKTQLALVIQKWALTALRLEKPGMQYSLFVQAHVSDDNPKVLSHKCCLKDELSEEVVTLSIASPSPLKPRIPVEPDTEIAVGQESEFGPEAFDPDFLAEIDVLAQQADLAAIPVHFYTPRVPSQRGADENSHGEAPPPDV